MTRPAKDEELKECKEREHFQVTLGRAPSLFTSSKLPNCIFHEGTYIQ